MLSNRSKPLKKKELPTVDPRKAINSRPEKISAPRVASKEIPPKYS